MFSLVLGFIHTTYCSKSASGQDLTASLFKIGTQAGRIVDLQSRNGAPSTNFIAQNGALGSVRIAYRRGTGQWSSGAEKSFGPDQDGCGSHWKLGEDLLVDSRFKPNGGRLFWRVWLRNLSSSSLEIGGLSMPLPMRTKFDEKSKSGVLKHSFISGAGSFMFWMRPDSVGPFLTMTPLRGTSLEYWNHDANRNYQVFVHSLSEVPTINAHHGRWRLPHTSRMIQPGESVEYGFALDWAQDYSAVRDILAKDGKLDVQVAPGMTVPTDLFAEVAIRSNKRIEGINAEHPEATEVQYLRMRGQFRIYRVRFRKLGENLLTVRQARGALTYLEFFACEPIETLIKKRAAFLTSSQVRDASKWYDGLLQEWNMDSKVHLSPDNYDRIKGWRIYEVTCDDPGLGKPAYLASKNAEYPVQAEVTALDDYIQHFVWGGLQKTTLEPLPYSIYGIPDWKTLRESKADDKTKGSSHVWRCYDYPHIILMYYRMYQIATQYPSIQTRLTAREYLERAYGTAKAMFTIPDQLVRWSPYETGYYNEIVIPKLIDQLRARGMRGEADDLSTFWVMKVRHFLGRDVDLFQSEYAFDSTGFESTEVLADFAMNNSKIVGIEGKKAREFLDRQMAANLFCRGVVEPAYYYLGSDYRGSGGDSYTLSYMAQMGGASVLDYGLNYATAPSEYLRLGYQSFLSSWALMNTGTKSSNYGYWYPGTANDGAAGGGFEPAAYGETWLGQPHQRGSWYYSCEIDLGYCGALRAARTTIADDPIFGRFCFGGLGETKGNIYRFLPHDGVRRRLSIRTLGCTLDLELSGSRFDLVEAAEFDERTGTLRLRIEPNESKEASLVAKNATFVRINGKTAKSNRGIYPLGASSSARWITIQAVRKPLETTSLILADPKAGLKS
jgi:hypothetical protein